jgi:predicted RNase H-like nuclease
MTHAKKTNEGRVERRALIDARWPGVVDRLASTLPRGAWAPDDLLDAVAVLWTAHRLARGEAVVRPDPPARDATGLRMSITA